MRLLYEVKEDITPAVLHSYLNGGHYRDIFIQEIQEKNLDLDRIQNFLQNFKKEKKTIKSIVSKEELQDKLQVLMAEKRKIFLKIAKNQNKRSVVTLPPILTQNDKKVTYLSKKR